MENEEEEFLMMKERVEKIRCEEKGCTDIVAERRADGQIVRWHKRRGETHITIIEPWALPGERKRVEIRCSVGDCARIVADRRAAGVIVIRDKHHGCEHVTIIEPWPSALRQDLAVDAVKTVVASDTAVLP
jgi:hypothetical protein